MATHDTESRDAETHDSDVLVSPEWLDDELDRFRSDDPEYRLVEADREFESAYADSHVPGAVGFDWDDDLQDSLERDLLKREAFEETLGEAGITEDTTVVLYGDESNQWAAYTYWQFRYWGHDDVRLLDGGRPYWTENDYPLTEEVPEYTTREYDASGPYGTFRIFRDGVREALDQDVPMVDVRSAEEFRGEVVAPEGSAETARRAGHIPGATHVSWKENYDDEGRFKSPDDLRDLYREYGVEDDRTVITYCRIGERSSLTWFALHELLDFEAVRNYDGSWTEWGSLIRAPIEADVDDPAP